MRIRAIIVVGLLTAGVLTLLAGPASAHEDRTIGKFEVAVGFAQEPAYAGQPNAVELFLNDDHGNAVTDLKDELQVTVTFNGETSEPLTFEAAFEIDEFGTPGDYRADFAPSQPGTYTFTLSGTFQGQRFDDEAFTSGKTTFGDVEDLNAASFPQVTAPTNEELATRIDQESTRTADAVRAASTSAGAADDAAGSARTVGIIGIVVGALGLVVAVAAISASQRTSRKARS
jgi:hypothetical protein